MAHLVVQKDAESDHHGNDQELQHDGESVQITVQITQAIVYLYYFVMALQHT